MVDPPDKIKTVFSSKPAASTSSIGNVKKVEVKAGEIIGYSIGPEFEQWDFGVYNNTKRPDFSHLDSDVAIHGRDEIADCPYDYFPKNIKEKYYALFKNHIDKPLPDYICSP